jgi:hypothetical protein
MTGATKRFLVPAALAAVLLTGCGDAEPEAELSPLQVRLAQIDRSLVDHRFAQVRGDLAALAADTRAARDAGDVSAVRADAILDAIIALRATLPVATPTPTPTPTPSPVATQQGSDGPSEKPKGRGKGKGRD